MASTRSTRTCSNGGKAASGDGAGETSFANNVMGIGLFIAYVIIMVATGKTHEVKPLMWVSACETSQTCRNMVEHQLASPKAV